MRYRFILPSLLLIGFLSFSISVVAQAIAPAQSPLRLGFGISGTAYQGDLTTHNDRFYRFNPGFNASLQFASKKLITPQVNVGFGKFTAQDRDIAAVDGIQPNTFVETNFFNVDLRLKVRFFRNHKVNPYGSIGIGLLGYTPRDLNGSGLVENTNTRNPDETYGSITASFPLSAGVEIHMNPILSVGCEYTYRPAGTDYLDNIGQLGQAEGNDKLHTLLLTVYFTLDPDGLTDWRNLRGRDRRD